jgi:hypothetical protein
LDLKSEKALAEIAFCGETILGAGYRKIEAAIFISPESDRPNSGMWVLGFELELLLIHKIMTTSGSIFLAGASRGVGHQIARILATQNLPVLALIRDPAAQSDL